MKIYAVGGAVRDELLGRAVKDHDYVVVGATPAQMIEQGFKPVGKDFPVFLHPDTAEEYALARTERKTAPGYTGFQFHAAPDVTLEQDLARRDLTINALARAPDGEVIDPYGGIADLRAGVLRHVSESFGEDPVRVLRVARFAARFGFAVAPETLELMREMARNGEVDALVPERVWQEFAKGLMEDHPTRMFDVLQSCDALLKVLPQWRDVDAPRALAAVRIAARRGAALTVRYASLWASAAPESVSAAGERLRAPSDCRDLAALIARYGDTVGRAAQLDAAEVVTLLHRADALRRPDRFQELLQACECDAQARGVDVAGHEARLKQALQAARTIDAGIIARANPDRIAEAVREARIEAVRRAFSGAQPSLR